MSEADEKLELGKETAASLVGTGIGLLVGGPVGALAGALAGPSLKRAMDFAVEAVTTRRAQRVEVLIGLAARAAGEEPDRLVTDLLGDPASEELFVRAVRVAQDAGQLDKLMTLAGSLASIAGSEEPSIELENAIVHAVQMVDSPHLRVLRRFAMSATENGLGAGGPGDPETAGREADKPMATLTDVQLVIVMPEWEMILDSLLATLQGAGLVASQGVSMTQSKTELQRNTTWALTDFGRQFLARLDFVSAFIQPVDC